MDKDIRWIDTHAHLSNEAYGEDVEGVIARAVAAGVERIIVSAWDRPSINQVLILAGRFPEVYCTVGFHPNDCEQLTAESIAYLRALALRAREMKIVAIGEIGLDYHYDGFDKDMQKTALLHQLEIARDFDLPVVIHERDAHEDCLNLLLQARDEGILRDNPGVFHCYSGTAEFAQRLIPMGWYFGFDGPLTFKNGRKAREAVAAIPQDRLLIETDSPYLTPHPHRGKRNEPAYLPLVAAEMATVLNLDLSDLSDQLWTNTMTLFPLLDR